MADEPAAFAIESGATPFVEALRASRAVLLEGSRIPHDLVDAELAPAG